ncbi:hypothetical protein LCGC14_3022540 [marine sediment metagenome]|uniref:Methylmalonyl-CoA mutase alpha/beta chain catalytic domain-containing protein n=1 Tax=marine sediment metagenome TaxID=412755 RepID=A0A0F8Z2F4_9ZZZZ
MTEYEEVQREKKRWEKNTLKEQLARRSERKQGFSSGSGPKQLYLPPEKEEYLYNLGFPGEYPYTRGVQATMYRGRLWTMRQYAGFGTYPDMFFPARVLRNFFAYYHVAAPLTSG